MGEYDGTYILCEGGGCTFYGCDCRGARFMAATITFTHNMACHKLTHGLKVRLKNHESL